MTLQRQRSDTVSLHAAFLDKAGGICERLNDTPLTGKRRRRHRQVGPGGHVFQRAIPLRNIRQHFERLSLAKAETDHLAKGLPGGGHFLQFIRARAGNSRQQPRTQHRADSGRIKHAQQYPVDPQVRQQARERPLHPSPLENSDVTNRANAGGHARQRADDPCVYGGKSRRAIDIDLFALQQPRKRIRGARRFRCGQKHRQRRIDYDELSDKKVDGAKKRPKSGDA